MSEIERKVLDYIIKFKQVNGIAPTREEIMIGLNYNSKSWIESAMERLNDKGYITVIPNVTRGIIVVAFPD